MQAEKTSSEDATIEIRADLAFNEASNGGSLLARVGEKGLQILSDDFVEKRLLRLVALVVGHVDPLRDRVGVLVNCSLHVGGLHRLPTTGRSPKSGFTESPAK